MALCHQIVVINFGRRSPKGSPEEIKAHPEVVKAYLGAGHA